MKNRLSLLVVLLAGALQMFAQKDLTATLESATVYLNGASLTHNAAASLSSGSYEVVVNGLSPDIELGSLSVSANGVLISATEFSNDFITLKEESARIKRLSDSLKFYQQALKSAKDELEVHKQLLKMLTDGTLNNMQQKDGTVSVADINANMELYKSKAATLLHSINEDNQRIEKLQETTDRIDMQLKQDQAQDKRRSGVLKLSVSVPAAVKTNFKIQYFTVNAGWTPCYDIVITSMDKPVMMKSKAKVCQNTGLDWNNVALTLSNATPNITNEAPVLKAWYLNFYRYYANGNSSVRSNTITYETQNASAKTIVDGVQVRSVEDAAPAIQMDDFVDVDMQAVHVNYNIAVPYDIPGNGKEQLIDLKTYEISASYKYYCVPKMTEETYVIATLSDYEKYHLLPGSATVTFDNTFVGRTFVNPNATDKNMTLTLATDPRVFVKREKELEFCNTKHVGNTTTVTQTYLITVKNNQTQAVKLTLKEPYPLSGNNDIEVKINEIQPAATYNKPETGVLTWDVEMSAGETRTFRVSYSVKYPKGQNVRL
ncbi:MAG: DUF4139 domain-containing protein [Bacteroidales bacterium]|nr:DUF4139 domain-containing protein [Bacteroidales bacterium]